MKNHFKRFENINYLIQTPNLVKILIKNIISIVTQTVILT